MKQDVAKRGLQYHAVEYPSQNYRPARTENQYPSGIFRPETSESRTKKRVRYVALHGLSQGLTTLYWGTGSPLSDHESMLNLPDSLYVSIPNLLISFDYHAND
jgi:hypothetical protein